MQPSRFGATCRVLVLAIAPAFLASSVGGQIVERSRTLADLLSSHPCNASLAGRHTIVTDCDAPDDLGNGAGAFSCFARCDGVDTWAAVSIGGGGGGGIDGTLTATDNLIVRTDGTGGSTIQASPLSLSDVSGVTTTLATITPAATTGATVAGQALAITASPAVASTDTAGAAAGGSVTITAGAAARNTSGNANGGDINLVTGAGIGTGTAGQILVPDGSLAAPAIALASDSNTGIYSLASGYMDFVSNGISVGRFDGNGFRLVKPLYGDGQFIVGAKMSVEASTAGSGSPRVLNNGTDNSLLFTNEGSTAVNYHSLPTAPAAAGVNYSFCVQDSDGMRVTAFTGDTIRSVASVTSSGGYIESTTVGSCVSIVSINATEWIATAISGTWSFN